MEEEGPAAHQSPDTYDGNTNTDDQPTFNQELLLRFALLANRFAGDLAVLPDQGRIRQTILSDLRHHEPNCNRGHTEVVLAGPSNEFPATSARLPTGDNLAAPKLRGQDAGGHLASNLSERAPEIATTAESVASINLPTRGQLALKEGVPPSGQLPLLVTKRVKRPRMGQPKNVLQFAPMNSKQPRVGNPISEGHKTDTRTLKNWLPPTLKGYWWEAKADGAGFTIKLRWRVGGQKEGEQFPRISRRLYEQLRDESALNRAIILAEWADAHLDHPATKPAARLGCELDRSAWFAAADRTNRNARRG